MLDATPDAAADGVRDMLTEAIGATGPEPPPADADLLGEPLHGRLLFAGEHTQSARLVYTGGTMASGIREANRLLLRTHVNLDPSAD